MMRDRRDRHSLAPAVGAADDEACERKSSQRSFEIYRETESDDLTLRVNERQRGGKE